MTQVPLTPLESICLGGTGLTKFLHVISPIRSHMRGQRLCWGVMCHLVVVMSEPPMQDPRAGQTPTTSFF